MENLKWQQWSRIEGVHGEPFCDRNDRRSIVTRTRRWLRIRELQKQRQLSRKRAA